MQNPIVQIFHHLLGFQEALKMRIEAYEHASEIDQLSVSDLQEFRLKSKEVFNRMTNRLKEIRENAYLPDIVRADVPKCSLYYAIAKSTNNIVTMCLSLQLGDIWFLQKFEEFFTKIDFNEMPSLKEEFHLYHNYLKYSNFSGELA